ncbi:anaphase-promoting complex subunit 15-like protein [Dinothrombium tinctorium]|uniref:Anaphase-promoting complex subunit 15-like protein n=1 Tax=Dinothrombium tinctorium TaxID=1965070 RepID=A0A3S3PFA9_9ACAR|nr:anaphase-promoting complex subunit 15-like protein [Dinothrombium tinctorium]
MSTPFFPSLTPSYIDSNWFAVDKAIDEDTELTLLEKEHQNSITEISQRDSDLVPCGHVDSYDEEDDEDDDDNDDDDESESNDDDDDEEIEVDDMHFNPDSPVINLI